MSIRNAIVGFSQIKDALGTQGHESVMQTAKEQAEDVVNDPIEATMMMMTFSEALKQLENAEQASKPGLLTAPENEFAAILQSVVAEGAIERGMVIPSAIEGLELKFATDDFWGWAKSGIHILFNKNKAPWKTAPPEPTPIGNVVRVGVLGDWGSGMYGAPVAAASIERDGQYDILMHIGDVYYSGTESEAQERFTDVWPKVAKAKHYALNANHEMYSGGKGYFNIILPKFGQSASYFALQNDKWLLVGLDTGYEEHDLAGNQVEWLRGILAKAGNRKLVLFSHHQPYSLLETQGPNLTKKLADLLATRRIFAWYWGHEHRCVLYDKHSIWGLYGRCVGHSGMPYKRQKKLKPKANPGGTGNSSWQGLAGRGAIPGALLLDGVNQYIDDPDFGPNGYLTLEFEGENLTEILHNPDGRPIHRQKL